MANDMLAFLVISFLLFSKGVHLTAGKKCKFEHKYVCGIQDCNCRYVSQNGVSVSSLYRRFLAMFSDSNNELHVCDKCDAFCSKEKHINCKHGSCDKQKGCICHDCWTGETCSKYRNHQPQFKQSLYVAEMKEDTNVGDEIVKVSAFDHDLETCVDKYNCPCGRVRYFINKGNEHEFFNINSDSGVISMNRKLDGQYDPVSLTILAKNEGELNTIGGDPSNNALATVVITSVENNDNHQRRRRSLHHRTRRSVTTYDSLISTFEAGTNATFFDASSTISYRLYLSQNQSAFPQTLNQITIQLSSENLQLPEDDGGYSVNISNADISIPRFNRSNAGTVQFSITDTLPDNSYMEIKFNSTVPATSNPLALLQVAFTMNATASDSVTYGPKYSPKLYTTFPTIELARTSKGVVKVETTLDYNVTVTLPDFNFTFSLVFTTMLNDFLFLSIENVAIDEISSSVKAQNQNPTQMVYTRVDEHITTRVVMDFGELGISKNNQNANTIKLSFSVRVNDHHMLENNSKYWIGVGSYVGGDVLGVSQDHIQIYKDEPYLFAEIEALNITDPLKKVYFINDELRFSWTIKHGNGSYENANNVTVSFHYPTSVVFIGGTGLGNLTSKNGITLPKGKTLTGTVTVRVSENVTTLADLNIEVKIRYKTSNGEDRPIRTYTANPGYLAGVPSFSLSTDSSNMTFNIGQLVKVTLKIIVERLTLNGKLYVYLPSQNDSVIMRFVESQSFTNTCRSIGSNIIAANFFTAKPVYNNSKRNGGSSSVELDLEGVRNVDNSDVATKVSENNTMTLKFTVVLEDNIFVKDLTNYSIVIGMKNSEQSVWVSEMSFTASVPLDRRPRVQIIPLTNGSDGLVQGSIVEYNFTIFHMEHSNAHATDVEVVWMLPVYTKFLKVNKNSQQLELIELRDNIMFTVSKLDFGQKPFVSFSVQIDPNKIRTKPGKNFAVTPVALTYKNKKRYFEPLIPISVAFTVPDPTTNSGISTTNVVAPEFYNRGYLVDKTDSIVYICSVSKKRGKPSCFWTNSTGKTWQAIHMSVINIIGIGIPKKFIYGIGNDMKAYMRYSPEEEKWYSILPDVWKKAQATSSVNNATITIKDDYAHESNPESQKQCDIGNGETWGANKLGVFHKPSSSGQWTRKACWDCLN